MTDPPARRLDESRSELPDDVAFVQKPFTPEELVNAVRRELVGG